MADYTVWYSSEEESSDFATNLIIIEAKKIGFTDSCLGQLTAYMGGVHAYRKDERKENLIMGPAGRYSQGDSWYTPHDSWYTRAHSRCSVLCPMQRIDLGQ